MAYNYDNGIDQQIRSNLWYVSRRLLHQYKFTSDLQSAVGSPAMDFRGGSIHNLIQHLLPSFNQIPAPL